MIRHKLVTSLTISVAICVSLSVNSAQAEIDCDLNDKLNSTADCYDGKVLSRRKRDFGGKEPIDWPKTYNGVFGVPGWQAQACEAFSDINFHLLGYNALGKILVFCALLCQGPNCCYQPVLSIEIVGAKCPN